MTDNELRLLQSAQVNLPWAVIIGFLVHCLLLKREGRVACYFKFACSFLNSICCFPKQTEKLVC
jgi:hypothetical protein